MRTANRTLLYIASVLLGQLLGCDGSSAGTGATGSAAATATAAAAAPASATAAATATAAAAEKPLAERFVGPPPEGIERSGQRLGVPAGWKKGDFGDVVAPSGDKKDGYAAIYDLPQFPPGLSQVELRTTSIGCRPGKLEEGVDGEVGSKKVKGRIYQGTCKFEGDEATVWGVAVNIDKTDNPKVILMVVKNDARARLEKDLPAIVQAYADSF